MKQIQIKWTEKEVQILKDNYGRLTYKQINDLLPNRTIFQIRNKANYEGLCNKNNLRKYSVNKEYFKVPNVENCYWAGFIAADGCISNKNRLSIGLKRDDISHLDKFVKDIEYTNPAKLYKDRCSVHINCSDIYHDLKNNFNITEKKSKTLMPPPLEDEEFIASYIKGLIDGDGSIMENSIVIYGTKDLLEWIKTYFDKWTSPTNYKLAEVRKIQAHLHAYKIGPKRKEEIFNRLKKLKCQSLDRKWNKNTTPLE